MAYPESQAEQVKRAKKATEGPRLIAAAAPAAAMRELDDCDGLSAADNDIEETPRVALAAADLRQLVPTNVDDVNHVEPVSAAAEWQQQTTFRGNVRKWLATRRVSRLWPSGRARSATEGAEDAARSRGGRQ